MASLDESALGAVFRNDIQEMRTQGIEVSDDEETQWIEWHQQLAKYLTPAVAMGQHKLTPGLRKVIATLLHKFMEKYPDFPALIARLEREADEFRRMRAKKGAFPCGR